MLSKIRERLTLVLVGLLPLHAFLVTVLTKIIAGPGHEPLSVLAFWKEALLGIILLIAVIELLSTSQWKKALRLDGIDVLILGLLTLAIILEGVLRLPLHTFAFGFKYDFVPLVAFLILRRVGWSQTFMLQAVRVILSTTVALCVWGLITLWVPHSFMVWLGYSDAFSLYKPHAPLAAFQYIQQTMVRRMQSAMSGPNQLGIWLLLPWSIAVSLLFSNVKHRPKGTSIMMVALPWVSLLIAFGLCIFLTFSRTALLAAIVVLVVASALSVPMHWRRRFLTMGGAAFIVLVVVALTVPSVSLRMSSTRGHFDLPLEAMQKMIAHPLGEGIGTIGPASNATSDVCVLLRPEDDPSWAKGQNLCVFLGDTQVQPTDRICHCPVLSENWYLQIGVELGVVGFVMYLALILVILVRLKAGSDKQEATGKFSIFNYQLSIFLAFLGVSTAAVLLHAWEDAAVAYSVWLFCAIAMSLERTKQHG